MIAGKKKSTRKKRAHKSMAEPGAPTQRKTSQTPTSSNPALLEKARNQWQFGDWASLRELNEQVIESHPDRARLALYAAAGHLQQGETTRARELLGQARKWGVSNNELRSVLISGVYNSLSRARLIQGREQPATALMQSACQIGMPDGDERLLLAARLAFQAAQLGLPQPHIRSAIDALPTTGKGELTDHRGQRQAAASGDELIDRLHAILENLTDSVLRHGRNMELDGIRVFDTKDPFRSGKLALAFSYRVTACDPGSAEQLRACRQFDNIVELTQDDPCESWGIYFYLLALVRLHAHGVLEKSVPSFRLEQLRKQLDWRTFIDEQTYKLSGKPNNYYGVAFGIAEHRAKMGWDDPVHGEILLQKMLHHYRKHSGKYGFADETEGQGRYDRYSVLLVAEIAQRFRETDRKLTPELQTWLRNSAEFVLVNLNENGDGFQFGRSIGAYGDTAFLEILSAAAWHGVLTPVETRMAYVFARRATRKFLEFWYDESRQSVNLWEDGRRTDRYRSKNRILGENLSLLHQHIYTHRIWQQLQVKPSLKLDDEFTDWLAQLPRYTLTRFSDDQAAKAALTVRDGKRLFSVWLVNPVNYHTNGAYTPAPFSAGLVQAIPDQSVYPLMPVVKLEDSTVLMPAAYFEDIQLVESGNRALLKCQQSRLATVRNGKLCHDSRVSVQTRFEFSPGKIRREDEFRAINGNLIDSAEVVFPVLNSARVDDDQVARSSDDDFSFEVDGYDFLEVKVDEERVESGTIEGPVAAYLHTYTKDTKQTSSKMIVSWTLSYR